jgi:hypothetical protein
MKTVSKFEHKGYKVKIKSQQQLKTSEFDVLYMWKIKTEDDDSREGMFETIEEATAAAIEYIELYEVSPNQMG